MYIGTYAQAHPDKPAIVRPSTGETLTFKQLDDRSIQVARMLQAEGLKPGDHVALFMENHLAFFEVFWGCARSGLYFTPINSHLSAGEAAYIVDDCDAQVLIASAALPQSAELGRLSPRCTLKLAVGGAIDGFADYEAAISVQPTEPLAHEPTGSLMLYSSGTTGRPKGILRPLPGKTIDEDGVLFQSMGAMFGFTEDAVYLSTAPMYHGAPAVFTVAITQAGGTVVMMDRFDAETALRLIEEQRITHSMWVPTMFVRLLKLDPEIRTRYDLSSHRWAMHAAAPCPVDVKHQMIAWWGPIVEEYYGSSEGAGMTTIGSAEWLERPGSVGQAKGSPIYICDDDGAVLPRGVTGTVYGETSAAAAAFAYHKDAGRTVAASHPSNPNLRTVGDIGYLDEDGYLFLTDRKAFMIISGGVNIYPQQIEDALALHPKLADVAVIGVPNEDLGEEVKAVVELAPDVEPSPELAEEIMGFVAQRLGRQLAPRSVDFVDALPRLPTGKLAKKPLRESYWKRA